MLPHCTTRSALALFITAVAWTGPALAAAPPQECGRAAAEAQKLRKAGKLVESRDELLRCSQSDCAPQQRKECEKKLHELEAQLPTIVVTARDDAGRPVTDATVSVDDRAVSASPDGKPIYVNPGAHVIALTPRTGAAMRQSVLVSEKDRSHAIAFAITLPTSSSSSSSSSGAQEDKPGTHSAGPWIPGLTGALMTTAGVLSLATSKHGAPGGALLAGGAGLVSLGGGIGWYFLEQGNPGVRRAAPWITAGYGGAMVAAGVITAIARSARPVDTCMPTDTSYRSCEDDYHARKTNYDGVTGAETAFFVVGGASLVIGATWALLDTSGSPAKQTSAPAHGPKMMVLPGGLIGQF